MESYLGWRAWAQPFAERSAQRCERNSQVCHPTTVRPFWRPDRPMHISSFFRCPAVNRQGGMSNISSGTQWITGRNNITSPASAIVSGSHPRPNVERRGLQASQSSMPSITSSLTCLPIPDRFRLFTISMWRYATTVVSNRSCRPWASSSAIARGGCRAPGRGGCRRRPLAAHDGCLCRHRGRSGIVGRSRRCPRRGRPVVVRRDRYSRTF